MRSVLVTLVALSAFVLTGCGGGSAEDVASPDGTQAGDSPDPVSVAPDELALSEWAVTITGDTGALVLPGESIAIQHLVHNADPGARSLGFRSESETDGIEVELTVRSVRVGAGEILTVESLVEVPDDVETGDVIEYEVIMVNVDDIAERGSTVVRLLVVDATGQRPVAGSDAGTTTTNERVISYVVRDDSDEDGDLELGSLRVIAGGFLADEISSGSTGTIAYVPFANVTGEDVVLYEICDSEDRCATATLSIQIAE